MPVTRKSAVSGRGSWFRRDSSLSLRKRTSTRLGSSAVGASTLAVQPTSGTSKRQRRSSKNLSVSSTNEAVTPALVKKSEELQLPNFNRRSSTTKIKSQKEDLLSVPVMPSSISTPLWLLRLYAFHRYSSIVAFLFVAATLAVYGWTVYSQEIWSQAYRRLQTLHRDERLLTTTNATLTNKMANEAERSTTGLVSPTPAGTIFLPPVSHSSNRESSNTTPNLEMQQQTPSPLGY